MNLTDIIRFLTLVCAAYHAKQTKIVKKRRVSTILVIGVVNIQVRRMHYVTAPIISVEADDCEGLLEVKYVVA
jgi:hypothetical protein